MSQEDKAENNAGHNKDAVELAITELLENVRSDREMEEYLHQKEIPEKDVDINYVKEYY